MSCKMRRLCNCLPPKKVIVSCLSLIQKLSQPEKTTATNKMRMYSCEGVYLILL